MSEDGSTKDDVKLPEGDTGDKINKLFRDEEKDTSEWSQLYQPTQKLIMNRCHRSHRHG